MTRLSYVYNFYDYNCFYIYLCIYRIIQNIIYIYFVFLWYKKYIINNLIIWIFFVGAARSGTAPTNAFISFVGAAVSGTTPINRHGYITMGAWVTKCWALSSSSRRRQATNFSPAPRRRRLPDLSRRRRPLSAPPGHNSTSLGRHDAARPISTVARVLEPPADRPAASSPSPTSSSANPLHPPGRQAS